MTARRLSPLAARLRRRLLEQPGISARPVCEACGRETEPRNFGREHCKACEIERAEASAYFQAQLDATLADEPSPPAEPMFGSDDAAKPFLPGEEDQMTEGTERHAAFERFLRRVAETQAYAIAGDPIARQVLGEYGLARWCGVPPEQALWQAESMVAHAERETQKGRASV